MAGTGIKLTGAWSKWLASLDPAKFKQRLEVNVRKATLLNALLVKREIRKRIKGNEFAPNSPLTLAIKAPGTKPLVHESDLFQSITHELLDSFNAYVGVNRKAKGKDGADLVNIGIVLHEGATLVVTPAMRAAVFAKARRNAKGAKYLDEISQSGQPAAQVWRIPPRPFIRVVMEDEALVRKIVANWDKAVEDALFSK